jgi:hypothetical protein
MNGCMQCCWLMLASILGANDNLPSSLATDTLPTQADFIAQAPSEFERQLQAGLKARRPVEFAFIAQVAQMVEQGQLPRTMVVGMFDWARERDSNRPFPHFEFGLRRRAATIGVSL